MRCTEQSCYSLYLDSVSQADPDQAVSWDQQGHSTTLRLFLYLSLHFSESEKYNLK